MMTNVGALTTSAGLCDSSSVSTLSYFNHQNKALYVEEDLDKRLQDYMQSNEYEDIVSLAHGELFCIYTSTITYNNCGSGNVLNNELIENNKLLSEFAQLEDNWDECGAIAPSHEVIVTVIQDLPKLIKQPDLFPTPEGNIQLEYSIGANRHLNIKIFPNSKMSIFEMYEDRTASKEVYNYDICRLNERITKFYGTI